MPLEPFVLSDAAISLVRLRSLMNRSSGDAAVGVAIIDGPVALEHPQLSHANVEAVSADCRAACARADNEACVHGTFVAGILGASRDSSAPGICPECTLLVRPVFTDGGAANRRGAQATLDEVATAVIECVDAGAHIINISASLAEPSCTNERCINDALSHAMRRGRIIVVAAGNQGAIGSSVITRHPWVIPVIACDSNGRPTADSNLSHSIGRRGVAAPGEEICSLASRGGLQHFSGTSAAAPFVSGACALLWSVFPRARGNGIRSAILHRPTRRGMLVPPILDAEMAFALLGGMNQRVAS